MNQPVDVLARYIPSVRSCGDAGWHNSRPDRAPNYQVRTHHNSQSGTNSAKKIFDGPTRHRHPRSGRIREIGSPFHTTSPQRKDDYNFRRHGRPGLVGVQGSITASHPSSRRTTTANEAPTRSDRSPAPIVHAASFAARTAFRVAYQAFVDAFRAAARCVRAGGAADFPFGAFPPPAPFVRPPAAA